MTEMSGRFALPLLQPGQAQKEAFHNEALALIDALLHPVAETIGDDDPPTSPAIGQCWIIGSAPTGTWTGQAQMLACWTSGGWRFAGPAPGMRVWIGSAGPFARWEGGWIVQAAIVDPMGGAVIDVEARAALAAILDALRAQGLVAP